MTDKQWEEKCNLYIKIHDAVVIDNEKLYALNVELVKALELCSKTSYIRDAHSIAIEALTKAEGK